MSAVRRAPGEGPATPAAAVLVAAAIAVVYAGARHAGFVGDDFMILHRLQSLTGAGDLLRFFRGEFFDYYRPLGFVAHAVDWAAAGADARQFHTTNIVLHAVAATLVLLIGRELSPRTLAGPLAALLFALHASNHEAVVWISARFDLLATSFALAAVWWMVRERAVTIVAPLLFLCAALSKEAAVALPVAAAAFAVFRLRATSKDTIRFVAPWIVALVAYSVMRHFAGGVSGFGGASRLPKLAAFAVLLAALVTLGGERWLRLRQWLLDRRGVALAACVCAIGLVTALAAAGGRSGRLAAEKLAVSGFAIFHLASPVLDLPGMPFYLDERSPIYWLGGTMLLAGAVAALALCWRPLIEDDRAWFLAAFLAAALLPISALTEGARYLYLPSAALSLIVGVLAAEARGRLRAAIDAALAVFLLVSSLQILVKVQDWRWAGRLTAEGAQLVDEALAPSCGEGHVVFLTEPVAIRAVYTHFLYETFELRRGCMPGVFQVLIRIVRLDAIVDARWDGPQRIVMTTPHYRDNFVGSTDLRHFDRPIERTPFTIHTSIGELRAEPIGDAEQLTLTLAPTVDASTVRFFYYSDGRIRRLN